VEKADMILDFRIYNKKEYIIIEVKIPNKNKKTNNEIDLDKEWKKCYKIN